MLFKGEEFLATKFKFRSRLEVKPCVTWVRMLRSAERADTAGRYVGSRLINTCWISEKKFYHGCQTQPLWFIAGGGGARGGGGKCASVLITSVNEPYCGELNRGDLRAEIYISSGKNYRENNGLLTSDEMVSVTCVPRNRKTPGRKKNDLFCQ